MAKAPVLQACRHLRSMLTASEDSLALKRQGPKVVCQLLLCGLQIPLIALTNWLKKRYTSHNLGNWIFWITFSVLGQPLCMLLYACVNI